MKLNIYTCVIATVILAMITSVSSAQSASKTAIPEAAPQVVSEAIPQAVVHDASSYVVGGNDGSMVVSEEVVPAQPAYETSPEVFGSAVTGSGCCGPAPAIQACECSDGSCTRCRLRRQRSACGCKRRGCQGGCGVAVEATPMFQSCEGDFCKLSTKMEKEKKTCFKAEQVAICIPAVRLPWQKCCPPSKSRTRLITKLKTEKTEVEACVYKWSIEETNDCGAEPVAAAASKEAAPKEAAPAEGASSEPVEAEKPDVKSDLEATIEENVVPPAPAAKGAFLRSFRKR